MGANILQMVVFSVLGVAVFVAATALVILIRQKIKMRVSKRLGRRGSTEAQWLSTWRISLIAAGILTLAWLTAGRLSSLTGSHGNPVSPFTSLLSGMAAVIGFLILAASLVFLPIWWRRYRKNRVSRWEYLKTPPKKSGRNLIGDLLGLIILSIFVAVVGISIFKVVEGAVFGDYMSRVSAQAATKGTFPFGGSFDVTGKTSGEVQLKGDLWLTFVLPQEWQDFECQDMENKGFWYWAASTGRKPKRIPPQSPIPRDRRFHARGETVIKCSSYD